MINDLNCDICESRISENQFICDDCSCGLQAFNDNVCFLKKAILHVKKYFSYDRTQSPILHGVDCLKIEHVAADVGEYGHDEKDDTPYDVDSVDYCGRCHGVID